MHARLGRLGDLARTGTARRSAPPAARARWPPRSGRSVIARHSTGVVAFRRCSCSADLSVGDLVVTTPSEQVGNHVPDLSGADDGNAFHRNLAEFGAYHRRRLIKSSPKSATVTTIRRFDV
jgi:hypothetical protein